MKTVRGHFPAAVLTFTILTQMNEAYRGGLARGRSNKYWAFRRQPSITDTLRNKWSTKFSHTSAVFLLYMCTQNWPQSEALNNALRYISMQWLQQWVMERGVQKLSTLQAMLWSVSSVRDTITLTHCQILDTDKTAIILSTKFRHTIITQASKSETRGEWVHPH